MVKEIRECKYCNHVGVVEVIDEVGYDKRTWNCPKCGRENKSLN